MLGTILAWLVFGLVVGALARFLRPGEDRMGCGMTILLGIMGSLLGGGISYLLRLGTTPYHPAGLILSVVGAILLLVLGFFAPRRPRRG
ncbi:MAG: GlsB/YeaQ/YmgE family stress response membrane protein [Thermoanaerobaculia bacterium]